MKPQGIVADLRLDSRETSPVLFGKKALAFAAIVAVLAGVVLLVHPSSLSFLYVFGGLAAASFLAACVRYPLLALYGALVVILLPVGLLPETVNSVLNRTLTLLAACVWALEAIRHRPRFIWPAASSFLLSFILWAAVTLYWARDMEAGETATLTYALRFVLFLVVLPNLVTTRRALDGLMNAMAVCGWVIVPAAFASVLSEGYVPGTRLALLRVNANELALALIVVMTGMLWQALKPAQALRKFRILSTAAFLVATIALVGMTGSRGGAISLFITLASLWFFKPTRTWGKLGLICVLFGALLFPAISTTTWQRFTGVSDTTPLGGREVLWREAWRLIAEHPLVGVGIGNSALEMSYELRAGGGGTPIHNPVLVVWSETGMPGLALYLGVFLSAAFAFYRSWRMHAAGGDAWLEPYFCLIVSVMLGYLGSWIKGGTAETGHTYFLMISLLLVPSSLDRRDEAGPAWAARRFAFRF